MIVMSDEYQFDRPVIILAAPRSGSTLLFETLTNSADFWTIGGESHSVFENIHRFNPLSGVCDSNALSAADASHEIVSHVRRTFFAQLRNSKGQQFGNAGIGKYPAPRLLEKTPKNALRIPLLNEIFPDALFIYLYRNPRENISSIIDAWHSGRFVTYRNLPGRQGPWSLLLPPGWQAYHDSPVERMAAFQWRSANTAILHELGNLDRNRWMAVSYGQQVNQPRETVLRICEFCEVSPDGILAEISKGRLAYSRYTVTPPAVDKWHRNSAALCKVLPDLEETVRGIRDRLAELPAAEFDLSIDAASDGGTGRPEVTGGNREIHEPVGRNTECPCGSGKKFKHCHGDLRPVVRTP
ncbi:MAG: sulfotransferase [Gammaproteobacteria bacterium]|nr:sulfotransferase [Gammaproteobacteria bacterium]